MLHPRSCSCVVAACLVSLCTLLAPCSLAADPDLEQAKKNGLANSRFLKPTNPHQELGKAPIANLELFDSAIQPLLAKHCLECHGPSRTEGRLRIDQISPNLLSGLSIEPWREIYNAIANQAMPPEDHSDEKLSDHDRDTIIEWISQELSKASALSKQQTTHSSFRRMTNYEFKNALEDLLGVSLATSNGLPPEVASEDGFKNNSQLLQMSAMQFETYRQIGLDALQRAIVSGPKPDPVRYQVLMSKQIEIPPKRKKNEFFGKDDQDYDRKRFQRVLLDRQNGQGIPFQEGSLQPLDHSTASPESNPNDQPKGPLDPVVLVLPASNEVKFNLDRFLPDSGTMRVRIRAGRSNNNPKQFASLRLIFSAHTSNDANFSQVISQRDLPVTATSDNPEFITFDIQLQDIQRNPFRKLATTFPRRDEFLSIRNVSNATGKDDPLCILIDQIEITAPFYQQWPPKSHRDIFLDNPPEPDDHRDANPNDANPNDANQVLERFLTKAWRRPIGPSDLNPYLKLLEQYRTEIPDFHQACIEVFATALASPEFLYITPRNAPGKLSEHELASRLSFFLWSSVPDELLLRTAQQGRLSDPGVLSQQVDRMLSDPRAKRFSENFVQQWLGTDGLQSVSHINDPMLRESMTQEPIAFFQHAIDENCSALDFIHSDYVVIDETMAKHYGILDVYGPGFRKVSVPSSTKRGGLLTNAVVLAMNSDGKDSHPLKRGVWILRRILQDPPPPPPPNVPQVDLTDPEIMKMSLKERIEDHRNKPACFSCHAKIDPWGIAFENYDAVGKYRTKINDQPVDAVSLLYNKQELSGMDGLKEYLLLNRQDPLCRAMVDKMMTYALGRPMAFSDRAQIDQLTSHWRKGGDKIRDLIHLVVASELFHSK